MRRTKLYHPAKLFMFLVGSMFALEGCFQHISAKEAIVSDTAAVCMLNKVIA